MKLECNCGNTSTACLEGMQIPKGAVVLKSNYCPECEDESNDDFWENWFEDKDGNSNLKYEKVLY